MSCNVQMEVCTEQVEWAKAEKRTFLRQRIEARLANLYLSMKDYSSALALISRLLTEASALAMRYVHTSTRVQAHYDPWAAADQSKRIWLSLLWRHSCCFSQRCSYGSAQLGLRSVRGVA